MNQSGRTENGPLVLGVTGSIASGKSTAVGCLAGLGAAVLRADDLAREAVEPGTPALDAIIARFGGRVLLPDGRLDRKRLAALVFSDPGARRDLEAITHPAIRELSEKQLAELRRRPGVPLVVYEAPLLFEAHAEGRVDRVLVITVPEQAQLRRLTERDGLSLREARERIVAQLPQAEKVRRADYVIENSGSVEALRQAVEDLFRRLVETGCVPG